VCSKSFTSCELRFDENTESPFGGFPGAGIRMGSLGA
jgi:phage-related protein